MQDRQKGKEIAPPDSIIRPMVGNSCPKRRCDVSVRVVDGETVVLDRQGGLIHQLNQTASYIWDRCNGRTTAGEIANWLTKVFDVDPNIAVKDVVDTLDKFRKFNLLEPLQK